MASDSYSKKREEEEEEEDGHDDKACNHRRSWEDLPIDILRLIARKVCPFPEDFSRFLDFSRFRFVCRSWLSVADKLEQESYSVPSWVLFRALSRENYTARTQTPWLLLAEEDEPTGSGIRHFYSPAIHDIVKIMSPESCGRRCVGSSHGWLVLLGDNFQGEEMRLLNPVTRVEIPLPLQSTLKGGRSLEAEDRFHIFIKKAVLTCSPLDSSSDCVVLVIYGRKKRLAFARSRDVAWTLIPYEEHPLEDVIYYDGKFLAVTQNSNEIVSCDISKDPAVVVKIAERPPIEDGIFGGYTYIVESSGNLLQVLRQRDPWRSYDTYGFCVFKLVDWNLPSGGGQWEPVTCLGDCSLFLGISSASISVSAPELELGGWRSDCIYYTDDDVSNWRKQNYDEGRGGGWDTGLFRMNIRRVDYCYDGCSRSLHTPPFWITPSLW